MITEDYVSFETAKLLKEKGFNGACNRVYQGPNLKYTTLPISPLMSLGELGGFHPKQLYVNNNELGDIVYTAPTLQMAMKWLREVHKLVITVSIGNENNKGNTDYSNPDRWFYFFDITNTKGVLIDTEYDPLSNEFPTYEQACEKAIKYCLKHLI